MSTNEVLRLTQAIQGRVNAKFIAEGLNKLLKNFIRQNKSTIPGSYYLIPFHKEVYMLLWRIMTFNPTLLS